jgi:cholesterol transport system auxiliary component
MILRLAPALAAGLMLGGCAALLGGGGPAPDLYELRAPAEVPAAQRRLVRDLVVEVPEASAALAIDRILIRPNPLQAQYLPRAAWSGTAPVMLQTAMLRTLEDTGGFRFVGRRPLGGSADFALVSELTDFEAAVIPDAPGARVRVRLVARLVREADAAVLASRSFLQIADAPSTEGLALATAFDAATGAMLRELAVWVLVTTGAGR